MIMKKYEQELVNSEVLEAIDRFNKLVDSGKTDSTPWKQLRSCTASVCYIVDNETGEILYFVLRSYNTIVAFIEVNTDTLYDFLRYAYGYTATSAQHIAKFDRDYCFCGYGCKFLKRYYDC